MLVLAIMENEKILVGDEVKIMVLEIHGENLVISKDNDPETIQGKI